MNRASLNNPAFTVGHSNHTIVAFITLLRTHDVTAVADVRSQPYSRFHPQFNREILQRELKEAGIVYLFLGKELGARSVDPACYADGRVQYRRLAQTALFRSGLERVREAMADHRVCLMCAEKEPLDCHRTLLVSRELQAIGIPVVHILADGSLEPHGRAEERLMALYGLAQGDLFAAADADPLEEAYRKREEEIAYVKPERAEGVER